METETRTYNKKHHNVFLDIETYGGDNKPSMDDVKVPANYKKEEVIKKYKEDHLDEAWAKQGLNSLKGEIICISYAVGDDKPISLTGTEEEILTSLQEVLNELKFVRLIGHNVFNFDFQWIRLRCYKYGLRELLHFLPEKKYDTEYSDTMIMLAGGLSGKDGYISLDNACKFLGIESSKGDINGSQVHEIYLKGGLDRIVKYCEKDIEATRSLFYKIKGR